MGGMLPGLRKLYRDLTTQEVKQFKGLDIFTGVTQVGPETALDALNVICSNSGNLEKMRYPVNLTPAIAGLVQGPSRFYDFQQANGTRQLILSQGGNLWWCDTNAAFAAHAIELNKAQDADTWDWVTSNNIAFGVNGVRAMKWTGTAWQNWGIAAPLAAPTVNPFSGINIGGVAFGAGTTWRYTLVGAATAGFHVEAGDNMTFAGLVNPGNNGTFAVTNVIIAVPNIAVDVTNPGGVAEGAAAAATYQLFGALTFTQGGRSWKIAYMNSVTGHISSASPPTAFTGNVAAFKVYLDFGIPPDPQVDTIVFYANLDGGSVYYQVGTTGLAARFLDNVPDNQLNQALSVQLINNPPIPGKYLCSWQGRNFIFNLVGAPQDIIYSGYERILQGRPEESFPPYNRLRLALGANEIRGGGVIQAGVVAFDNSNKMYMFRGLVEDVTVSAPIMFAAYLEQLPWQTGCMSHYSICSTPYGLVWFASDKTIQVFNGQGRPDCLSHTVNPLLSQITPGTEPLAKGTYLNWLDREWYVLTASFFGSFTNNRILFFDLDPDPEKNVGVFISDIPADNVNAIEDTNGQKMLCVSFGGRVQVIQIAAVTQNGMTIRPRPGTGNMIRAYWRGGYYGNEAPQTRKMFRDGRLLTDANGFGMVSYLVDDRQQYTLMNPLVRAIELKAGQYTINRKGKRLSLQIVFPSNDIDCAVQGMYNNYVPTGDQT